MVTASQIQRSLDRRTVPTDGTVSATHFRVSLRSCTEGIAEHYINATIPLKGVILDPSLDLAA